MSYKPLKTSETHKRSGLSIGRIGGEKLSVIENKLYYNPKNLAI